MSTSMQSMQSTQELKNESKESDINIQYKTMTDLNFANYKPIFSRKHLEEKQISITLTEKEQETFEEIKCAISNKDIFNKPVIVRCAGGWVRDKLLNCNSDDIDLAIDTMTGEQFGDNLQTYFEKIKNTHLNIGKIQENPDKSKHLASITFKLNDIEFDVVNLRTETYTSNSRIPQMCFGTAEQDAFRRDLTINALFYNINTGVIEDLTGKGIHDLINGICRTPLNAMVTYGDDPLRILRNIRHCITKLGFNLHNDIINAAQHPKIHNLLQTKVSRERFAVEFEKMLRGYNVWIAMHCLVKFGLTPILFQMPHVNKIKKIPNDFNEYSAWQQSLVLIQNMTQIIADKNKIPPNECYDLCQCFVNGFKHKKDIQKDVLFAAFTYPFSGIQVRAKKKKIQSLVMYFVLYSMPGMPNATKLAETVNIYHAGCNMFVELLKQLQMEQLSNDKLSLFIGKFLYLTKQNWIYVLYLVQSVCCVYHKDIQMDSIRELELWIKTKSQLMNCWKWKPLLNGKALVERYEKYGLGFDQRVGQINQIILEKRLANPSVTIEDLDNELIEWLKCNVAPQKRSKKKSKK